MPEEDQEVIISMLEEEFGKEGMKVFPISAVSGQGVKELLWHINSMLKDADQTVVEFEPEYNLDSYDDPTEPFTVEKGDEEGVFIVEGPRIERMLGYTNLESEKGFVFFQKFMKDNGILDQLDELGIQEGDTVKIYGHEFEYYK